MSDFIIALLLVAFISVALLAFTCGPEFFQTDAGAIAELMEAINSGDWAAVLQAIGLA